MDRKKRMEKILATQITEDVKADKAPAFTEETIEIPYITKEKKVETRTYKLYTPENATKPMPLIFVAHYSIGPTSPEVVTYFKRGWALACPGNFIGEYNSQLTDNDLVFNSAAYYTLRRRGDIDKNRIAVVGGSAGGYMTLMLTGLHLGICCSLANSPLTNIRFTIGEFFRQGYELNKKSLADMTDAQRNEAYRLSKSAVQAEQYKGMTMIKLPVLASIAEGFLKILDNFPDKTDEKRFFDLSPIGLAEDFTNPFFISHFTCDGLVPIDQITKRFTYPETGKSLPRDFDPRLPEKATRPLECSLEELLPPELVSVKRMPAPKDTYEIKFATERPFVFNIYDEGPMESYSTHRLIDSKGGCYDAAYYAYYFEKTAAETVWLNPEKLELLLDRYLGNSVALPPAEGVDDTVYGSLAIYRKEVKEELADWVENHSPAALAEIFDRLMAFTSDEKRRSDLQKAYIELTK